MSLLPPRHRGTEGAETMRTPAPQIAALAIILLACIATASQSPAESQESAVIEGEPILLEAQNLDPKYKDYFTRVARMIKDKWVYPCVKNAETRECEYKTTEVVIDFGI